MLLRRSRTPAAWIPALAVITATVWGAALVLPIRRQASSPGPEPPVAAAQALEGPPKVLPAFATVDGMALHVVSSVTVAVAFHEASYDDAKAMRPLGTCRVCRNRRKFAPPPSGSPGLRYIVTDSRGRDTPATSAADLVLRRRTLVTSPVTGTVTKVRRYRLYYRYPDVRVEIRPSGYPQLRVVLIHLGAVRLARGDLVEPSITRIGVVRRLPFRSQVDRYVQGRYAHVHLEVKDTGAGRQATSTP